MKRSSVVMIFVFVVLHDTVSAQLGPSALTPVHNLVLKDRTMNALVTLAERYKVVIGVYGTIVGGDSTTVDISLEDGTVKDVLDAIVSQDHRFEWRQDSDGIYVSTRTSELSLLDAVIVSSFDSENLNRVDAVTLVSRIPEVNAWLELHNCTMDEIIAGHPPKDWIQFSVHAKAKPLSSVFDEIAAKSNTYFWSAIQYSRQPCAISVRP